LLIFVQCSGFDSRSIHLQSDKSDITAGYSSPCDEGTAGKLAELGSSGVLKDMSYFFPFQYFPHRPRMGSVTSL